VSTKRAHRSVPWGLGIGLAVAVATIALWGGMGPSHRARAASPVHVRMDGDDALCNGAYDAPSASAPNCAFATLGQAVHAVDSDGTISVAAGTYFEVVEINKNLSLQGAGPDQTIVDGGALGSVVAIDPGCTVTVSNVTLRGGTSDQGGGVYNRGTLTLVDSVVFSNTATLAGGGIWNDTGGSLAISDSTVMSNTALILGIGGGGGIYNARGSVVISTCAVVSNTTLSLGIWAGGAASTTSKVLWTSRIA